MEDRANHCRRRRSLEGSTPARHLVEHRAKREEIAARIGFAPGQLFRRHAGNVPRSAFSAVSGSSGEIVGSEMRSGAGRSFARPKSSSFAPSLVSITLPGLRSRWTGPADARDRGRWRARSHGAERRESAMDL